MYLNKSNWIYQVYVTESEISRFLLPRFQKKQCCYSIKYFTFMLTKQMANQLNFNYFVLHH
jgi:hypothetical protein